MIKYLRYLCIFSFIISLTFLSGCDYMDVNNFSIVTGISLDKKGNKYVLAVQVVNPSEIAGRVITQRPEILVYHVEASNNEDIFTPLSLHLAKTLDTSHTKVVVIGERLARENLLYFNDLFDRNILFNQTALVLVSQGGIDPAKFLTTLIPDTKTTANRMEELLLKGKENYSSAIKTNFDSIVVRDTLQGVHPTVQGVSLSGKVNDTKITESVESQQKTIPPSEIILGGIGIFKDLKLLGFLEPSYTPYFGIMTGESKKFYVKAFCGKEKFNKFAVYNVKLDQNVKIKNGTPEFTYKVSFDADLTASQCNYDQTYRQIAKLEKTLNLELEKRLIKTVSVVQKEFAVDAFGTGELVRKQHRKFWQKNKGKWDDYFAISKFKFQAKSTIRSYGLKSEQPSKKIRRYLEVGPNE